MALDPCDEMGAAGWRLRPRDPRGSALRHLKRATDPAIAHLRRIPDRRQGEAGRHLHRSRARRRDRSFHRESKQVLVGHREFGMDQVEFVSGQICTRTLARIHRAGGRQWHGAANLATGGVVSGVLQSPCIGRHPARSLRPILIEIRRDSEPFATGSAIDRPVALSDQGDNTSGDLEPLHRARPFEASGKDRKRRAVVGLSGRLSGRWGRRLTGRRGARPSQGARDG